MISLGTDNPRVRTTMRSLWLAAAACACTTAFALTACGKKDAATEAAPPPAPPAPAAQVDVVRLQRIDKEPGAWLTTGRDAGKRHHHMEEADRNADFKNFSKPQFIHAHAEPD